MGLVKRVERCVFNSNFSFHFKFLEINGNEKLICVHSLALSLLEDVQNLLLRLVEDVHNLSLKLRTVHDLSLNL